LPGYRLKDRAPCIRASRGCEVLPFAQELDGENVIEKHTLDGFCNPKLEELLKERKKNLF